MRTQQSELVKGNPVIKTEQNKMTNYHLQKIYETTEEDLGNHR